MADEWWGHQKGLRQTLRPEVAVGKNAPDAQLPDPMLSHTGTDASIFAATAAAIRTNAHDRVEDQRAFSR